VANDAKAEALTLIGSVQDRDVIIVDDEIDTAGSIISAVQMMMDNHAGDIYVVFCPSNPFPGCHSKLATLPRGLVLVTGPTGSGKSTTLAAIIDEANRLRKDHIITIEDPIEFVHKSQNCIVNQREVGIHTKTFASALRGALREDPDIILVGEMRDLDTISLAVEAASTGHLVFPLSTQPVPQRLLIE